MKHYFIIPSRAQLKRNSNKFGTDLWAVAKTSMNILYFPSVTLTIGHFHVIMVLPSFWVALLHRVIMAPRPTDKVV